MLDMFVPDVDPDESDREPDIEGAVSAAAESDAAVVFVRDVTSEGVDRESLRLPDRQNELVEAVTEVNDRTVVVVNSSGPMELPWREEVAAIVEGWYPGQVHGDAAAAVLFGDADPGGRLPVTFAPEATYPTAAEQRFPGEDGTVRYEEGVFVGYRHFDERDTEPTYPFGHGLSYAEFTYVDAELDDRTLSVTIENESNRDGSEVVQAYVRPPETDADRPVRELGGFEAVSVHAGDRKTVDIGLSERAFRRYDESAGWTVDPGTYTVAVGRSSRDIRIERELVR